MGKENLQFRSGANGNMSCFYLRKVHHSRIKGIESSHELWFGILYIIETQFRSPLIFQTINFLDEIIYVWNIKSLHYQVAKIYGLDNFGLS